MLIPVLAIVLASVAWLVIKRMHHADPAARATAWRWLLASVGAVLALRVGMAGPVLLRVALGLLAFGAVVVWLLRRGHGGGGGGGGGDPPVDPDPDPGAGQRATPPRQRLDADEFDRARADWERPVKS